MKTNPVSIAMNPLFRSMIKTPIPLFVFSGRTRLTLFAMAAVLFASCSNERKGPDVSGIEVDLKLERFEQDFFKLDTSRLEQGLVELGKKYPDFTTLYLNDLLLIEDLQSANGTVRVGPAGKAVVADMIRYYGPLYDSIRQKYPNLNGVVRDIKKGMQHVKYYYPQYAVPGLITFVADFNAPSAIITPRHLGIGLQKYAGKNFSAYQSPEIRQSFPEYISRRFDEEYIAANCMQVVVDDLYPFRAESASLIEQIVERGKQWYLLDLFLPDAPDSVKTGYTRKQLDWCEKNEGNIWNSILRNNPDIYTIDPERIQEYVGESPTTQDMVPGTSPGNIGQWVGWQIVKKFAAANPKLTVQQVLNTPARELFGAAKYRPK